MESEQEQTGSRRRDTCRTRVGHLLLVEEREFPLRGAGHHGVLRTAGNIAESLGQRLSVRSCVPKRRWMSLYADASLAVKEDGSIPRS